MEQADGLCLSPTHEAFPGRLQIVMTGEMQPPVDHVKEQFFAEIAPMSAGVGGRSVDGDADFAGEIEPWIALERDDVRGGGVGQEVGVQPRPGPNRSEMRATTHAHSRGSSRWWRVWRDARPKHELRVLPPVDPTASGDAGWRW